MQKTWTWSTSGYVFLGRPHEEIQQLCRYAGLDNLEFSLPLIPQGGADQIERLGAQYRAAGVGIDTFHLPLDTTSDIASFYETWRLQAVNKIDFALEQAAQLGARVAIQHPSTSRFDIDLEGFDNYLRQLDKSLATLLPRAEQLGITIALENMVPGERGVPRLGSRPEHFARFATEFAHPNLGFCLDTGHALVAGGLAGADVFYQTMAPHIVAFHLADNAGDRDSHLAPGRGLVNWDTVFQRTVQSGYAQSMCIETPPFAPGPDYSQDDWRALVQDTGALVAKALKKR
ncbi:MAG: TIM barrel protein [Candidatus Latescibacteria bacterium]|nr:TIM barrel protein [Candidatus Latescibacterota bacterium]